MCQPCHLVPQVALVCAGIAVRGVAYSRQQQSGLSSGKASSDGQWWGVLAMLGSALGYSTLGVLYDLLVRTEDPAPSHAEIMEYTSRLGAHIHISLPVTPISTKLPAYLTSCCDCIHWLVDASYNARHAQSD